MIALFLPKLTLEDVMHWDKNFALAEDYFSEPKIIPALVKKHRRDLLWKKFGFEELKPSGKIIKYSNNKTYIVKRESRERETNVE